MCIRDRISTVYSYVLIRQSECKYIRNWVVEQIAVFLCALFFRVPFFFHICFGLAPWVASQPSSFRTGWIMPGMYLYAYRVLLLLLLSVIMCRMTKFVAGSLNLISLFSFSSFKHDLFLMRPLAVLLCRIFGLDLPICSVMAGMRGAKAGVSPPRQSPPCTVVLICTWYQVYSMIAAD